MSRSRSRRTSCVPATRSTSRQDATPNASGTCGSSRPGRTRRTPLCGSTRRRPRARSTASWCTTIATSRSGSSVFPAPASRSSSQARPRPSAPPSRGRASAPRHARCRGTPRGRRRAHLARRSPAGPRPSRHHRRRFRCRAAHAKIANDTGSAFRPALIRPFGRYRSAQSLELREGSQLVLDSVFGLVSRDIGVDLGTANTLVHVRGRGIVISEPSVVAKDTRTGAVLAIGAEAKRMVGRTPASITAVRPLKDGVISDFDITEQMLRYFIQKVHSGVAFLPRPRVIIGIPSGVTEVEKRAVQDAALSAGARWCRLVEEPMAAAIGAGLPVNEPSGSMIVDIGGGTTEGAVTALGGSVLSRSIRIGGGEMGQDLVSSAGPEGSLLSGERTAEDIKIAIGSAYPLDEEVSTFFRGRDLLTGLPRSIEVTSAQIREAIEPSVERIVDAIKDTLEETPPELVADVMDQGIYLAGGGALLRGLDTRVAEASQMAVHVGAAPLTRA